VHLKNDNEKLPVHCTWKVAGKGFQDKVDIIKLTTLIICQKNQDLYFSAANHCKINVYL